MPQTDILYKSLIDIGLSLSAARIRSIQRYVQTLEKWNRTMNLTALKGSALVRRLVVEPLWVAAELSPSGRYLDIGSGNGSPAIPWHILQEFVAVDLVESRRRRATFLQRAIREIGLTGVRVHPIRFEDAVSGSNRWTGLPFKAYASHPNCSSKCVPWVAKRHRSFGLRKLVSLRLPRAGSSKYRTLIARHLFSCCERGPLLGLCRVTIR